MDHLRQSGNGKVQEAGALMDEAIQTYHRLQGDTDRTTWVTADPLAQIHDDWWNLDRAGDHRLAMQSLKRNTAAGSASFKVSVNPNEIVILKTDESRIGQQCSQGKAPTFQN